MAEEKILLLVKVALFNFVFFPHSLCGLNIFPPKICLLVLQIIISTMSASYSEGKAGGLSTGSDQDDSVNSSFLHKDSCCISSEPGEAGRTAELVEWIVLAGRHLLYRTQEFGHRCLLPPMPLTEWA